LENERKLKFFKIYSKSNCEQEEKSFQMLRECGCVMFYMVREKSIKICGIQDLKCVKEMENNFEIEKFPKCYEACNQIFYQIISKPNDKV
jgi:acid-sensing ion channel, other